MSDPQTKHPKNFVKDLIGQLSAAVSDTGDRTLGLVGPGVSPAYPPAHCLRTCLHSDPQQLPASGCPWLEAAATGRFDTSALQDARCPSGFLVAGQPIQLNGQAALLVAVQSGTNGQTTDAGAAHVLERLDALKTALEKIGQLLDENEGLAEEVLRSYEQLNLIFDFHQQIARFTVANDIERALLRQLGELLHTPSIVLVEPGDVYRCYSVSDGKLVGDGRASTISEHLVAEMEAARASRTVVVQSLCDINTVIGPLVRLDDRIDMVLAMREPGTRQFTAGETMLAESLLAFGGQIICNAEVHERLRRMSLESTRALVAAIDKKDHYTSGHSERVGYLARLIGERLGVPANELQILEMSGLLHDVGKIGIPEVILCKPGRLTKEEYEIIKSHPRMGHEILTPIASFGEVLEAVLHHHENPDGSGYPAGLRGNEVPLFARIIHAVDVFDALTSTRSYRVAFSPEQACDILRTEAGAKLDADVVAIFLEMIPAFQENPPAELASIFRRDEEVADVAS
jgi:HD-GYP domain-containing protein (c-di-GMP phosphodiesterase class II)